VADHVEAVVDRAAYAVHKHSFIVDGKAGPGYYLDTSPNFPPESMYSFVTPNQRTIVAFTVDGKKWIDGTNPDYFRTVRSDADKYLTLRQSSGYSYSSELIAWAENRGSPVTTTQVINIPISGNRITRYRLDDTNDAIAYSYLAYAPDEFDRYGATFAYSIIVDRANAQKLFEFIKQDPANIDIVFKNIPQDVLKKYMEAAERTAQSIKDGTAKGSYDKKYADVVKTNVVILEDMLY